MRAGRKSIETHNNHKLKVENCEFRNYEVPYCRSRPANHLGSFAGALQLSVRTGRIATFGESEGPSLVENHF